MTERELDQRIDALQLQYHRLFDQASKADFHHRQDAGPLWVACDRVEGKLNQALNRRDERQQGDH